jgi:flagellar assembly protein FliH
MNMSNVIKLKQGEAKRASNTVSNQKVAVSVNKDFLSYESIWQMTDGASAEADSSKLERMKIQYDAVLEKSKGIINKAHADAARIEQDAYQKGYEQGQKDGEAAGRQRFEAVIQQFNALFQTIQKKTLKVDQVYQQNIIELIKVMVRRLVDHEISVNPEVIRACLESALGFVVENARVKIHLSPADYRNFSEFGINIPGVLEGGSRIQLVEDASITAGGCLLSSDYGDVDATVGSRCASLFEVLEDAFTAALNDFPSRKEDQEDPLL